MKYRSQGLQHYLHNHKKLHNYGGIAQLVIVLLLVVTAYSVTYLYIQEKQNTHEIHIHNLQKYNLYSKLMFYAGYGGYIHNFKNTVLRNDKSRLPLIEAQKSDILSTLKELKKLEDNPEHLELLKNIESTFKEYFSKHPILINAIQENWNPNDTDILVKVNDADVPANLMYLFIENRKQLDQAVHEQETRFEDFALPITFTALTLLFFTVLFGFFVDRRNLNFHKATISNSETISYLHQFYDGVLENIHDCIFITDQNGTIEECNQQAMDFFGYNEKELFGQNISVLIPPNEHKTNHDAYMRSSSQKTKILNKGRFLEAIDKNGRLLPVKITVSPFESDLGLKYIGVVQDVRREHELMNKLEESLQAYKKASLTDFLTGLLNRNGFYHSAPKLLALSDRNAASVAVIMIDIDHFKQINDQFGHDVGDLVLQKVSDCLQMSSREQDILARWGGEEFILLLQDIEKQQLLELAERTREAVENLLVEHHHSTIDLTISIGLCYHSAEPGIRQLEQMIKCSDNALYQAKENGRNRIEILDDNCCIGKR